MSAVFDPVANSWTMIPPPPGEPYIGDVPSTVLPNGRFIFGSKLSKNMWSLDPATLTWTAIPSTGKNDNFAEEGFTQLPGGTVFTVDMTTHPSIRTFRALAQHLGPGRADTGHLDLADRQARRADLRARARSKLSAA